ncbi:VanW family protein [Actinoalloteichus caeruleus]|uniref:VanW family protein n=1 Tax=Actinoalloteichus cyanogriseus TaxID=2893586 RepID=UPI003BB9656C
MPDRDRDMPHGQQRPDETTKIVPSMSGSLFDQSSGDQPSTPNGLGTPPGGEPAHGSALRPEETGGRRDHGQSATGGHQGAGAPRDTAPTGQSNLFFAATPSNPEPAEGTTVFVRPVSPGVWQGGEPAAPTSSETAPAPSQDQTARLDAPGSGRTPAREPVTARLDGDATTVSAPIGGRLDGEGDTEPSPRPEQDSESRTETMPAPAASADATTVHRPLDATRSNAAEATTAALPGTPPRGTHVGEPVTTDLDQPTEVIPVIPAAQHPGGPPTAATEPFSAAAGLTGPGTTPGDQAVAGGHPGGPPTTGGPGGPLPQQPPGPDKPAGGSGKRRTLVKAAIAVAATIAGLAVLYGVDMAMSSGKVPRGVEVAGVDIGGMDRMAAEERLRDEIGPRLGQPIEVTGGDVTAAIEPDNAGLSMNWSETMQLVGDQPLNPITRLTSFFSTTEIAPVPQADRDQLASAVSDLAPEFDREAKEGDIRFEGSEAVPVNPVAGQRLDVDGAVDVLMRDWANGHSVALPVEVEEVGTTEEGVQLALEEVARPAVSGPLTVTGEGANAIVEPATIGELLTFTPGENGGLDHEIDREALTENLSEQLKDTEEKGQDAEIVFSGGSPSVKPSVDGRAINWETTLEPLEETILRGADRRLAAHYEDEPAEVTTEDAENLGVKEVIGEFTTGGFAPDSGQNIKRAAEQVNGAIVKPGDTFSLNGHTGPRQAAQGYVDAGIIEQGKPGRAVGGGISQFATTLYNAYYFAGLEDVRHQEHSYYISRYPMGREATVFQNPDGSSVIDVSFRNNLDHGVAIQTIWTSSDITVRIWGTKQYQVESDTGEPFDHKDPETVEVSDPECSPSAGGRGFSVTDTRVIKDLSGQEVRREPRTVHYRPQPKIECVARGGGGDAGSSAASTGG